MQVLDLAVDHLADCHDLRWIETTRSHVGILHGTCLAVAVRDGEIVVEARAEGANLEDEFGSAFAGLTKLRTILPNAPIEMINVTPVGGVPTYDPHACLVRLTPAVVDGLSQEQFEAVPDALARDLAQHGGRAPHCPCGQAAEAIVHQTDEQGIVSFLALCDPCLKQLFDEARDGRVRVDPPPNWAAAIVTLLTTTTIFGLAWGAVQDAETINSTIVMFLPLLAGWLIGYVTCAAARGSSPVLQRAAIGPYVVALFGGNVWGFQSSIARMGGRISFPRAAWDYLTVFLPANLSREGPFFVGGAIGAVLLYRGLRTRYARFE